jgi:hypothetical protein
MCVARLHFASLIGLCAWLLACGTSALQPTDTVLFHANFFDALTQGPLVGANVCLLSEPEVCQETDSTGAVQLAGLKASGDGVSASFSNFVTGIWPVMTSNDVDNWRLDLRPDDWTASLASQLGVTLDASMGIIVFQAYDSSGTLLPGVSVSSSTGGVVGYLDTSGGALDAGFTANDRSGQGFIFNVPVGNVSVSFASPGLVCQRQGANGWPADGGATSLGPVVSGEMTRYAATCQ